MCPEVFSSKLPNSFNHGLSSLSTVDDVDCAGPGWGRWPFVARRGLNLTLYVLAGKLSEWGEKWFNCNFNSLLSTISEKTFLQKFCTFTFNRLLYVFCTITNSLLGNLIFIDYKWCFYCLKGSSLSFSLLIVMLSSLKLTFNWPIIKSTFDKNANSEFTYVVVMIA